MPHYSIVIRRIVHLDVVAALGSSFQQVEERKRVFHLVAPWDSRFRQEQAGVSAVKDPGKINAYGQHRSTIIEDAKNTFRDGHNPALTEGN